MPKYNYKKDALTDYFKGKLSAKELDKIARDDFKSGIATKKELSNFLSNKFTQDVMSDTYGIPAGTLVKRVRGLMKFAEGVNEMDPHYPVVSKDDEEEIDESRFAKKPEVTPKQLLKIQNDVRKVNRKIKVYISKHPVTKGRLEIELGHGHDNDAEIDKIYDILKKHTGSWRTGTMFNEGQKRYNQKDGVGKSKYVISYHDGKKKHKDGSDFFDIQIFKNKKDLAKFVNALHKGGYKYGFGESVNEDKFYNTRVQYTDPKSKKKFVGDVVRKDGDEYKVNLGKDGRFEKYILAKAKDLKIVSKSKKRTYESVNEGISVFDERHFGKKGIIIMIDDNGKKVSAIFKDKKNADKFNRNKPSDIKKLLQLAKKTKYPKAIDESVNEGYGPFIKAKNLNDIIKLSKQKKNATFYVTDDNNSRIGTFYLKNGKFAKATTANPNYDLQRNKTKLKDRSDVIYKYKVDESVNEAYVVLYSPKKGVKPVTTAAYKDKKDAEKWAKDLGGITMIVKKKVRYIDETKAQINKIKKQAGKKEIKFYDILSNIEKKLGKNKYRAFLVKSLKDFKINGNHYDYRSNAAAEEKLFQVSEVKTNEDLRNWFKSKWVNIGKKDKSGKHPPCGTSGKKRGYAKCVPAKKAASMSKKEKESATRRKRAAQNKSNRGGKSSAGQGKKPINVSTHTGGRKSGTGKGS